MIREFSVENYLSIRDKQTINFVAKGPASELVEEITDGVFLYKLGILFGANASGKSNMLIALNTVFRMLVEPKSDSNKKINGYIPFIPTKESPTKMDISFYVGKIRYDYHVEFNDKTILKEILNYYPNGFKSLFYERTYVAENIQANIIIGPSLRLTEKTKESIRENTLNNHSVLAVCVKNSFKEDIEPFNNLYNWIMSNYHEIDGDEDRSIIDILKRAYEDPRKRKFFNIMLCKADLNILDYKPVFEERYLSKKFIDRIQSEALPDSLKEQLLNPVKETVIFTNHSAAGSFDVPLRLQSKGTEKYIKILDALFDMITGNHVYYLDELGEDLHYDLLFYYINAFLYNSDKSQLIITSQETSLLHQDLINDNRGVVWFVEKNRETASSVYSRGDSYGLHKNMSLYNSYRIGRLGAKPELGSIFIDLDN
ncbi:MAG: ATP-binding protein [Duncaniella sp.]|nr:ATP-binding protein [Duncaniella sp.]